MKCYRNGGCGPYEMYSCSECPASKKEYLNRYKTEKESEAERKLKILEEKLRRMEGNE